MTTKLDKLKASYLKAKTAYYNSKTGATTMTDAQFDALEDEIRGLDPKWPELKRTGVKVGHKTEVLLPVPMPSLNKIHLDDERKVSAWFSARKVSHVHVSAKLDGSSVQLVYERGQLTRIITRGDGTNGKDISHFIPYVTVERSVKAFKLSALTVVRCEAIMHKSVAAKYAKDFETPRAAVSGILNRQDVHPALKHIGFIALRVLAHGGLVPSPSDSNDLLDGAGLDRVRSCMLAVDNSMDKALLKLLDMWKGEYAMDGIVVVEDRPGLEQTADKPKHSVAFKDNEGSESLVTEVVGVVWQESRYGALTPKAELEPVKFADGTKVTFATLHNAQWMKDKGVGPGAKVRVIRSGEIIPKIVEVLQSAEPEWPDVEHEWRGVDLYVTQDSVEVVARKIEHVVSTLGFEHTGGKFANALAERIPPAKRKMTTVVLLLLRNPEALLQQGGLSEHMASKVAASRKADVTLDKVLQACDLFPEGMGAKRAGLLADCIRLRATARLDLVAALGMVFGNKFYAAMQTPEWQRFVLEPEIQALTKLARPERKVAATSTKLQGQCVSWTGYRDEAEELWVQQQGGLVVTFGAKTTILLYRAGGKSSSKLDKARASGKRVTTFAELKG